MRELDAAATDVGMIRSGDRHVSIDGDTHSRFGGGLAVHPDAARENERARAFPRRGESAVDQQGIETDRLLQFVRPTTQCAIAGSCPPSPAPWRTTVARSTHSAASLRDTSNP